MVKKQYSISLEEKFIKELDKIIKKYNLASRSALIQQWSKLGLRKLKEEHGIPFKKGEIAPEV